MRHGSFALAVLLLLAAPAQADDSSAALDAGSIVFTKNTPIRMAAEDLYVSPDAVRIRFEFTNPTKKDVKTIVAFPLPDIDTAAFWGSPIGTVTDNPQNFVNFKAVVDGKPVALTVEQRAFVKGKDVTAQIEAAGAPVNPVTDEGYLKLEQLPKDKQKQMIAEGLAEGDAVNEFIPQWTVRTRFYWTQDFPAGKTVVIEHSYQPVTGQFFYSPEYIKRTAKIDGNDYCIDDKTWAAIMTKSGAAKGADPNMGYLVAYQTDYILKTATNWQGPIGRFHLTLDKLKPDNILTLCWDGALKKTGPTTFEFTADNFVPKQNIDMLVLESAVPH